MTLQLFVQYQRKNQGGLLVVRTYFESIKKWAIRTGVTAVSAATLIFIYLQMTGVITILSQSGDMICSGIEGEPCTLNRPMP